MISFSTICGINGTFYIKSERSLCTIKINECLVAKYLLTNVTKTNEHSNVTTFVHALLAIDTIDGHDLSKKVHRKLLPKKSMVTLHLHFISQ